jgi:hypothetical protein
MREFKESGVNRISIGVQSFNDSFLSSLDRDHSSKDAIHSIQSASQVFGDRFSFDLMFSLPNQSISHCHSYFYLFFYYLFLFIFIFFYFFFFFLIFYFSFFRVRRFKIGIFF